MTLRLTVPLTIAGLTLSMAARAAILTGTSLSVDDLCAKRVTIAPDASLHGQVAVDLTADDDAEVKAISLTSASGDSPAQVVGHFCSHGVPRDWRPTLLVAIRMPAGAPLAITEGAVGDFRIGAIGGPLRLRLSGATATQAAQVTSAHLGLSGTGAVAIDRMDGDLTADLSGSTSLSVKSGRIGQAHLDLSGVGSASIGAPIDEGWFAVSGVGNIALGKSVRVVHRREVSGVGSISTAE